MFYKFKIHPYLLNPGRLADEVDHIEIKGFWQRLVAVFIAAVLLFSLRSIVGIHTENLTSYLLESTADFTVARFASLLGSMVWALVYVSFHVFVVAWIFSFLIDLPFKKLLPMQVLMTVLLLIEKLLVFIFFVTMKSSVHVSFLSFGPLAATFFDSPFIIYFLNQLSIFTAVIIGYQYHFFRMYGEFHKKYRLLALIIGLHLLFAIATASVTLIPFENVWASLFDGGGGNE